MELSNFETNKDRFIIKKCPICNYEKDQKIEFSDLKDNFDIVPGIFNLTRCKNCQSLYLKDPLNKDNISKAYPNNYYCYKENNITLNKIKDYKIKLECSKIIKELNKKGKLKILEIGAGTGLYSKHFKSLGYEVYASDINRESLKKLELAGIKTKYLNFEEEELDEKDFDIIIMSHVIEHFYNPRFIFYKISKMLVSGGILYVKTPNAKTAILSRYSTILDVPRHIVILSREAVRLICEKNLKPIIISDELITNDFINYFKLRYKNSFFNYNNPLLIIIFLIPAIILKILGKSSRMCILIKKN
jgi:2-polyprenyl-3-methyl-5-hydroxy-6-metoxy-1,4-benzoquinol methylase